MRRVSSLPGFHNSIVPYFALPIAARELFLASLVKIMKRKATDTVGVSRKEALRLAQERVMAATKSQHILERLTENNVTLKACKLSITSAFSATIIFAQGEAGTGVCISPSGVILTCDHCVEGGLGMKQVIIFATGQVYTTICTKVDKVRDLALLQIEHVDPNTTFPFVTVDKDAIFKKKERIVCIGQPGQDDLESTTARKTGYEFVHISFGSYLGRTEETADPQDNREIGQMVHTAWTYWGHSGAPIVARATGKLVGLHSSWDDETCSRHGIPLVAIVAFLNGFSLYPP